jgi:site-specific DNA-cytosine methylase
MRVLVACEYSARVRDAFRRRDHDAWSCDLLPCEGDPRWHLQQPVEEVLGDGWDLMIAHPPCTHLAVSGSRHFHRKQREQAEALDFVRLLMAAPIDRWCIENPVSIISSAITPPPTDHPAVAVWSRRNQGNLLVAQEPATLKAQQRGQWSRSQGASDAAGARSMEGAQPHISGRGQCHGATMGHRYAATTDAAARPCHLSSKSSNTSA